MCQILLRNPYYLNGPHSLPIREYQNGSGNVGIDVDINNAIAKNQGFNVKLTNPGFTSLRHANLK